MSQQTIRKFLIEYKSFVNAFHLASTPKELVGILTHSSGMNILPTVLFFSNGNLKSFDHLYIITAQHLELMIKKNTTNPSISLLLLGNTQTTRQRMRKWVLPGTSSISDEKWFESKYAVTPTSPSVIRAVLMKHGIRDLRWYITDECEPRIDLSLMLAQLRHHFS